MWTLDELVDRVRRALAAEYPGAPNNRVRDLPDRRAIRWYTTIGLVDRPLGMRGRSALYGPRHLLQLVALKRRQAEGRTLAEIQAELAGAADDALAGVARVPAELLVMDGAEPEDGPVRSRFWAAPATALPARAAAAAPGRPTGLPGTATVAGPAAATEAAQPATGQGGQPAAARGAQPAATQTAQPFAAPGAQPAATQTAQPAAAGSAQPAATDAPQPAAPRAVRPDMPADAARAGAPPTRTDATPAAGSDPPTRAAAGLGAAPGAAAVGGVALGRGAILVLPGLPTDADRAAIAAAARPLLDLLADRGLLNTENGSPS
jgi:DNA-binding transcriptional MerR regulator